MEFLKLFADMEQLFEPFTQAEKGSLLDAMMAYCFRGEEPEFTGNERFIWPVLRRHINQCAERSETLRENARKGGRPKASESKTGQTKPAGTKKNQTKPNETKEKQNKPEQEQEQEQEHEQEQEQEQEQESGRVIGIDGSDLTEAIRAQDTADAMILRYNLPHDIPTREKLLEDLLTHGEARMREVLEKACESNTRDRVTSAYWRAILANAGKGKPKAAPAQQGYQVRDYASPDFRRMEVDVEAEAKELGII